MKYQVIGDHDQVVMESNTIKAIYAKIAPTVDLSIIRKELREINYIIVSNGYGDLFVILSGHRKI